MRHCNLDTPADCPEWFSTCYTPCGKTNPTGTPDEPDGVPNPGDPWDPDNPDPTPTGVYRPTPTMLPSCGDGSCSGGLETCASCPEDCGMCTGIIRSRAVYIDSPSPPCAEVVATAGFVGSSHLITANSWFSDVMIQETGDYVTFPPAGLGLQNLSVSPPAGSYSLTQACWRNSNGSSGEGQSAMLYTGETLTFDVAFGPPGPWSQIQGGDVYASASIKSDIPGGIDPSIRMFMRDTAVNDNAGVLLYGADYDFDTGISDGSEAVSATNRRVKMDPALPELHTVAMVGLFGVTTPL